MNLSTDTYCQYSANLLALIYVSNALLATDPEKGAMVLQSLCDSVKKEFSSYNQYLDRFDGIIQQASDAVNQVYLKSYGQKEGCKVMERLWIC